MSRILITAAAAIALAVPGTAAAHHPPKKNHKPKPPPVVVTPSPTTPGPPAASIPRAGYCKDGVFLDLILGQPDVDPLYAGAVPANVGLPGNPLSIWC